MTRISVIIPTLNEATRIGRCLSQFRHQPGDWDLVVSDGGSSDGTVALAVAEGARIVNGSPGRGPQMNRGEKHAEGGVLLFLHADALLPSGAYSEILAVLGQPGTVAGAFRVRHVPERWAGTWKAGLLRLSDLRSHVTSTPYGDQGIFLRREAFHAAGRFLDQPMMEDLHLSQRLKRHGQVVTSPKEILVSSRRFESGLLRAFLCMNTFPLLDRLGVPSPRLARLYGHPR